MVSVVVCILNMVSMVKLMLVVMIELVICVVGSCV